MLQKHGLLEQSWLNKSWWGVSTSGVDPRSFDNLGIVYTVSAWAWPLPCSPAEKGGDSVWPFKECTSHGAMDGDKSLLAILRIKGDSAPF